LLIRILVLAMKASNVGPNCRHDLTFEDLEQLFIIMLVVMIDVLECAMECTYRRLPNTIHLGTHSGIGVAAGNSLYAPSQIRPPLLLEVHPFLVWIGSLARGATYWKTKGN